ncbi:hypothetical protein [Brytella acorum]|uniref:Uncharacterized protein n=1 Tax=Brytella acorum TaxID=2959299 RepID=A0AA35VB81_9PROT|nr:hypothetical protein [Brytella acorum]CAI9120214.1 hypothetical protein LMG32879_001044 [Brytella acorum]
MMSSPMIVGSQCQKGADTPRQIVEPLFFEERPMPAVMLQNECADGEPRRKRRQHQGSPPAMRNASVDHDTARQEGANGRRDLKQTAFQIRTLILFYRRNDIIGKIRAGGIKKRGMNHGIS